MIRQIHDSALNIRIFGFDRIKMPFIMQDKEVKFVCNFGDFVDLIFVVSSIVVNNIK